MKKIYLIFLLILFCATSQINAQRNIFAFQYSVGYTSGDFNNFIDRVSGNGMSLTYHNLVRDEFGLGFEIGYNHFWEEKDYATYNRETVSLSGKQYRYCFAVPLLFSLSYYANPGETVNPYVSFGIGTEYTRNDLQMGLYTIYDDVWHFAIRPEVGVILSAGSGAGVIISAKYYDAMKSGDIGKRSYFTTNIGLAWTY